ncbi:hypothetical protein [Pseudooceanicola sp. C21-150M6]|uniref:hypothetical protein n=1 Tax=Pseudooceanicola sp. C21-150M6 TaxID=3434355 RepID=UPI003D7F8ACB
MDTPRDRIMDACNSRLVKAGENRIVELHHQTIGLSEQAELPAPVQACPVILSERPQKPWQDAVIVEKPKMPSTAHHSAGLCESTAQEREPKAPIRCKLFCSG